MSRKEFSATTKKKAYDRAKGLCATCSRPLQPGKIEYDHLLPDALGGKADVANCIPLCKPCHKEKTKRDVSRIRKADRQGKAHIGAKTAKGPKIEGAPFKKAAPQSKASKPLEKKVAEHKPIEKFAGLPRRALFR